MTTMFDVIKAGAERPRDHVGMSDEQLDCEHRLQRRLYAALDELCKAVREVNEGSATEDISLAAVEAFIHDEMPHEANWDERIRMARLP